MGRDWRDEADGRDGPCPAITMIFMNDEKPCVFSLRFRHWVCREIPLNPVISDKPILQLLEKNLGKPWGLTGAAGKWVQAAEFGPGNRKHFPPSHLSFMVQEPSGIMEVVSDRVARFQAAQVTEALARLTVVND